MTEYDPKYTPHPLMMIWIIIVDNAIGLKNLLVNIFPVLFDMLVQAFFGSYMPRNMTELVNVETFSRVCGRKVSKVEFATQKEQHANSTARAWLRVRFVGDSQDTLVFAKCQANNLLVRAIMSIFGIYRNEFNAYSNIEMPVPTARVFGAKYTPSRFVLVMEDLSAKGVEFPNIWSKNVDRALGEKVLTTLAKIHARFWGDRCPKNVWDDENRPYQGLTLGFYTLFNVERRCRKGLIPPKIHKVYMQALWHWRTYRAYLSASQPKCLCHGDSHMGNFYIEKDGTVGAVDFQVFSQENPIRDVTYFLSSSYNPDLLEKDEASLIKFYLNKLKEFGVPENEIPTFDEAWYAYRMQLFYALYAFIFSGGFANLMDHVQTEVGGERIIRIMERVDSTGALYEMLDGRVQ